MLSLLSPGLAVAAVGTVAVVFVSAALVSAVEAVNAYEERALLVRGEYRRMLEPGLHVVPPFVSETHGIDRRTLELRPDLEDLRTADGTSVDVALVATYSVDDPGAAFDAFGPEPHLAVYERVTAAMRESVGRRELAALQEDPAPVADAVERALRDHRRDGVEVDDVGVESVRQAGERPDPGDAG